MESFRFDLLGIVILSFFAVQKACFSLLGKGCRCKFRVNLHGNLSFWLAWDCDFVVFYSTKGVFWLAWEALQVHISRKFTWNPFVLTCLGL